MHLQTKKGSSDTGSSNGRSNPRHTTGRCHRGECQLVCRLCPVAETLTPACEEALKEDEFGSYAWRQPYPGIPRADAKSGKASFDGQGQMINPSQGP
ncbi:hypothetical protein WJX82_002503 [Trebouxia sp. C0006]